MPLQRLFETALATASSTGAAQFNFPSPPTMLVWEGTIGIVGPPSGAQFFALVGGSQWCSWNGNNVGGPVQALPGEEVIVTATGLSAGVQYTAQWIGFSVSRDEATLKYPATSSAGGVVSQPPGTSLTVTESGGAVQATGTRASAGSAAVLAAPAAGTTYLLKNVNFTLGSGATQVQLVGHTSGFVYAQTFSSSEVFEAMEGQIATEALDIVTTGGGGSLWLSYDNGTTAGGASSGGSSGGGGGSTVGGDAIYASGADGPVTFDGSTVVLGLTPSGNVYTLARDIITSSMTVNTGVAINTNGFRVFVKGPLTNNGTIRRNGNAGAAGTAGAAGGALLQNVNGSIEGGTGPGKAGGNGGTAGDGANGQSCSSNPIIGGSGGAGGNSNAGHVGGAAGASAALSTLFGSSAGGPFGFSGYFQGTNANPECGAGGGGGGGDGVGGHNGGGGGGGGARVYIAARTVGGTGTISANGGTGGAGDPAGNTGGGGGGGGGVVQVVSSSVTTALTIPGQTITANGGAGGAAGGAGVAGTAGTNGFVVLVAN